MMDNLEIEAEDFHRSYVATYSGTRSAAVPPGNELRNSVNVSVHSATRGDHDGSGSA